MTLRDELRKSGLLKDLGFCKKEAKKKIAELENKLKEMEKEQERERMAEARQKAVGERKAKL